MDDNKMRFGVGVLVIAAIGVGVILTFLFGAFPTVLNREYTLQVWFPSAEGVSTNTPVLRDGFKIGRVSDIRLVNDLQKHPDGGVVLSLKMDQEHRLTHEYIPRIGTGSFITGDSKLEFVRVPRADLPSDLRANPDLIGQPYGDGEYCNYGDKASDPFGVLFNLEDEIRLTMQSIRGAGGSIEEAGESVKTLIGDLRTIIGAAPIETAPLARATPFGDTSMPTVRLTALRQAQPDSPQGIQPRNEATIRELTSEAVRTLEELQGAIRDVRSIVSDPQVRDSLQASVDRIPKFLDQATETLETVDESFESIAKVSESFERVGGQFEEVGKTANGTIKNIDAAIDQALEDISGTLQGLEGTISNVEKFTEPLGDRGGEIIQQVLISLANLDNAVREIQGVGALINRSDGTIRRLIEDDELYFDVLRTIENIEMASAKLRPIMDDVRIFSDKIARDPRQLGVRGAVTNRPSGLGLK